MGYFKIGRDGDAGALWEYFPLLHKGIEEFRASRSFRYEGDIHVFD